MKILVCMVAMMFISACQPTAPESELNRLLRAQDQQPFAPVLANQIGTPKQELATRSAQRMEWWYFTGNLQSDQGRQFGYQLTFFRFATAPGQHLMMGHYAISDIDHQVFYSQERFARWEPQWGGQSLGQITSNPLQLAIDHWQIQQLAVDQFDFALSASVSEAPATSLQLQLRAIAPAILQGDNGYSQKSSEANNASMYFSLPRLQTSGEIFVAGERHQVTGLSWFDREASSSQLGSQQRGWRWFALHLDDGTDLMLYGLIDKSGAFDRFSAGSLQRPGQPPMMLKASDFVLTPKRIATMSDGQRFATEWSVQLPEQHIALQVQAAFDQQYWQQSSFPYWEGAVTIKGTHGGRGYLEMTGGEGLN